MTEGRPELQELIAKLRHELRNFSPLTQGYWTYDNPNTSAHACLRDCLSALVTVEALSDAPGRPVMDQGTKSTSNFPYAIEKKDPADTCSGCGGPYVFDASMPSAVWNAVIRAANLPEYLCLACIVREFGKTERSFTAVLSGNGFHLVPIEVRFRSQPALDVEAVNDENNRLRQELAALRAHPDLRAWVQHKDECRLFEGWIDVGDNDPFFQHTRGKKCTCGLDVALRSLKEGRQAQTEASAAPQEEK